MDIRKNFFTEKAVRQWNGLSREVLELLFLKILKKRLDVACNALV